VLAEVNSPQSFLEILKSQQVTGNRFKAEWTVSSECSFDRLLLELESHENRSGLSCSQWTLRVCFWSILWRGSCSLKSMLFGEKMVSQLESRLMNGELKIKCHFELWQLSILWQDRCPSIPQQACSTSKGLDSMI
jgi:hypothetical protein